MSSCNAHTTPLPWCPSCRLMNSIRILKEPPPPVEEEPKIVSWTQPICDRCWPLRQSGRLPVRSTEPEREQCCDCGMPTTSGIYIREDPMKVRYPKRILGKTWKNDWIEIAADPDLVVLDVGEATPAADL